MIIPYNAIYGFIAIAAVVGAVMYFIGLGNGYNKCLDEHRKPTKDRPVRFIDGKGTGKNDKRRFVRRGNHNPRHNSRSDRPTKW